MSTERERLVEELENKFYVPCYGGVESLLSIEGIADFILADRLRICAPAKEALRFWLNVKDGDCEDKKMVKELVFGIEETLRLAGLRGRENV